MTGVSVHNVKLSKWELRISDERPELPGILLPFSILLLVFRELFPESANMSWELMPGAYGHGLWVCEIEDKLVNGERVHLTLDQVLRYLKPEEEYFENVRIVSPDGGQELARHDSTVLIFRGSEEEAARIAKQFKEVEMLPID